MYKLVLDPETNEIIGLHTNDDHTFVPIAPSNLDYQEYLDWVAQGNTPEPPDPVE